MNQSNSPLNRNEQFDICKGIGIILMLIGHSAVLTDNWSNLLFRTIFSFHMPLFFIISGYFFKPRSFKDNIKKSGKKLLLPYLFSSLISILLAWIIFPANVFSIIKGVFVGALGNNNSTINFWPYQAGAVWFLLALFVCKTVFGLLYNYFRNYLVELSVILSIVFWIIGRYFINIPLCLGAGFSVLVFYYAGYALRNCGIDKMSKSIILLIIVWAFAVHYSELNTAQYTYTIYPLSVAGGICGSFALIIVSKYIRGFTGKILAFTGRNTLPILCCHSIAFMTYSSLMSRFGYDLSNIRVCDLTFFILTLVNIAAYSLYTYLVSLRNNKIQAV